jgi:phosphoenolpyruvate carboxykinase (ATP)
MLAERMQSTNANCWLINTGWVGGKYGTGSRCPLKYTRAIINAIHSGSLASPSTEYTKFDVFGLNIPVKVDGVPDEILDPRKAWKDQDAFRRELRRLATMFVRAFTMFEKDVDKEVKKAGPVL